MKTQDVKRKLNAILSTDVVGYSHLMGVEWAKGGGEYDWSNNHTKDGTFSI